MKNNNSDTQADDSSIITELTSLSLCILYTKEIIYFHNPFDINITNESPNNSSTNNRAIASIHSYFNRSVKPRFLSQFLFPGCSPSRDVPDAELESPRRSW